MGTQQRQVGKKYPTLRLNAWQAQVWVKPPAKVKALPGEVREKAWQPQVGRREAREQKTPGGKAPPPPHTMSQTPLGLRHWASAGRVSFYYFVFLKRRKCIRGLFSWVFGIRGGPSQGSPASARASAGIRACVLHMYLCESTLSCQACKAWLWSSHVCDRGCYGP